MPTHDPALLRILDANANRAREALRVLEDIARFALQDLTLAQRTKSLRHALGGAMSVVTNAALSAARDVEADVGTSIQGALESSRDGARGMALAAGKRLTESLRSLEECMKALAESQSASMLEHMRYDAYSVDAAFALRLVSSEKRQWRVCLLLTQSLCARPWQEVLDGALRAGVDCIQVREKTMTSRELLARVCAVRERAQAAGATTIVNDDLSVALASGADGVHLGGDDLPVRAARRCTPSAFIIGATTHSLQEAREAIEDGADYCGVGALFSTAQKPALEPAGTPYLQAFLAHFPNASHLAIGGINVLRAAQLVALGCRGVAVSSAICAAEDPAAAARELVAALRGASQPCVTEGAPS